MNVVGIDLGTTNSALAWIALDKKPRKINVLPVQQLIAPGEIGRRPTLPSLLYLPGEHELPAGAIALPWDAAAPFAAGELARVQGALVPGRLIASAKSWLCHPAVDRQAAILPWAAPPEVERRSPIDVSAAYLAHLGAAYRADTGASLADADLVLTVPASFDEAARELTVEAAKRAGLERLTLLEEPQAAFYSWLADHGESAQTVLAGGETVLVCDIGGGTTDFTVITVEKTDAGLAFHRTAVGDHLLLGGDNMDLALARRVEKKLAPQGKLDPARFQALTQSCRTAKERLLDEKPKDSWQMHLAGRGRGLVAGALQAELSRAEVEETVLDGFFPRLAADAAPAASRGAGLREFGLPFAQDPAVTAHLAAFLRRHSARPDVVLFNGGVLTSPAIRERILDVLAAWHGRRPTALDNAAPDLAVARGAAYYALVRRGEGVRIAAGAARAFYVEVDASTAPEKGTITAVCIAPRGELEGGEITLEGREFELLTNRPVRFRLLSSSDRSDPAGALVTLPDGVLAELPPIVTVLRFARSSQDVALAVRLQVQRTELGTLDVQLVSAANDRWKLAFDLRSSEQAKNPDPEPPPEPEPASSISPDQLERALSLIRRTFDKSAPDPVPPAQAMKELTAALAVDKSAWPTATLRRLWEPLKDLRGQRGRSAEHEARWLNLVGYCLRPGYGYSLDDWRVKEAWRLFNAGLVNEKDPRARLEWWILWRRVSGGLTRTMQDVGKRVFPHFLPDKKKTDRKAPSPQEAAEMWRVVGSLERIHREEKWRLGEALLPKIEKSQAGDAGPWAIGRLGARVPLYGPIENVVNRHKAEKWVDRLLALDWAALGVRDLAFAASEIARASGDRARDLDEALRHRLAARLAPLDGGARLARLVLEPTALEAREERFAFGEALPAGLRLTSTEGRVGED